MEKPRVQAPDGPLEALRVSLWFFFLVSAGSIYLADEALRLSFQRTVLKKFATGDI
jgi:hypothetical protein